MAAKRPGKFPVINVLLVTIVCILALFFYLNLGGAVGPVRLKKVSGPLTRVTLWNVTQELSRGDLVWTEEELPPFYIFNLAHESDPSMKDTLLDDCTKQLPTAFCQFLFEAPNRVYSQKEAKIFLVPIFESVLFTFRGLHEVVKELQYQPYFMKFRGSDFVFICYTQDCHATKRLVLDGLGTAVRAIWVDRGGEDQWPCADRKITVDADGIHDSTVSDFIAESRRVQFVLRNAGELVDGKQRWNCSTMDHWGLQDPLIFDYSTISDTSFKSVKDEVAYCGIPKVGSSVAVLMMRRMNDMENWKISNTVQIRNFHTGYNWTYKGKNDLIEIFDQTQWITGVLVRNPITRLLSGYRSKIEDLKEYNRIPGGWPRNRPPPSLETFVGRIKKAKGKGKSFDWMDRHIRPQSALCSIRTLPFDFVGRYEDRADDLRDFLMSLELWEKLGASGWGPDGQSALYEEDEQIVRQKKLKPVTHAEDKEMLRRYYTRELVETVIDLYDEDFTRFGFSKNVDDYI